MYVLIYTGIRAYTYVGSMLSAVLASVSVSVDVRVPSQVIWVDKEDASPRHCGWGGCLDMANLKHQPHGGGEWDTFIAGKSHHLCVCVCVCLCVCMCTSACVYMCYVCACACVFMCLQAEMKMIFHSKRDLSHKKCNSQL